MFEELEDGLPRPLPAVCFQRPANVHATYIDCRIVRQRARALLVNSTILIVRTYLG
jgi:hypothetical protein